MRVSEYFTSIQGEGSRVGKPSFFIRLFGCNLQCQGFGQQYPTKPETYKQPWRYSKVTQISDFSNTDLEYGCDSVYSWAAQFKQLSKNEDIRKLLIKYIDSRCNDLVITGGEPLLKIHRDDLQLLFDMIFEFRKSNNYVTIETNGTQPFTLKHRFPVLMSISPKLYNTSGEKPERAINIDNIADLTQKGSDYQLKFVSNGSPETNAEIVSLIMELEDKVDIDYDKVYIMPVGADIKNIDTVSEKVANFCIQHNFRFCDRLHARIWGNKVGK